MFRTLVACAIVSLALPGVGSAATDQGRGEVIAPNEAVAAAWAQETKGSSTLHTLFATYAVAQGLDMVTTVVARNRGAIEANPVMGGSYAWGVATKAAVGAVTMFAVRAMEKKSKKAAIITMIACNVATGVVVAHNMRIAGRLK